MSGAKTKKASLVCLILFFLVCSSGVLKTLAQQEYRLGQEDEIKVQVWDNDDLTRTLRVGLDGRISFPFVGELKAEGLTVLQLQKELERKLAEGYIVDPHVSIKVIEYKSQKFFVVGNVGKPGTYPLTKDITVVEAISMAGGIGEKGGGDASSGSIAIIVRARPGEKPDQPRLPNKVSPKERVTVSLSKAMNGDPQNNVLIQNGDTIFVPRLMVYVTGEVKRPGRYPFDEGMTVLAATITAGGYTDKASSRGTYILRRRRGTEEKIKVDSNDLIQPGDTIVVPESWF
jgi:polysaccharide export outer membrane protein